MVRAIDPSSDRAVYKQIADRLRDLIASGELAGGEKLPSESALMREYDVSQGTVRQALSVLRGEGLVVAEHGRGVFVRDRPKTRRLAHDRFSRKHRERGKAAFLVEAESEQAAPSVDLYYVGPAKASAQVARLLGVRAGARVLARRRRYSSDGRPTEIATSYIPWSLASGTQMMKENSGPGGIYARIEEAGHRLGKFTEEVTARMPTQEEARALHLAPGSPVLVLVRVAYDTDAVPVEVCDTVMSAEQYTLAYELPAD